MISKASEYIAFRISEYLFITKFLLNFFVLVNSSSSASITRVTQNKLSKPSVVTNPNPISRAISGSSMNEMMTGLKGIQATDEFASFVSEVADAREIIGTIVTTDLATFGM